MAQTHSLDLESSSSQSASIADASQTGLDLSGDFTIEAWVKFESLPGSGTERDLVAKWASNQLSYKFATFHNGTDVVLGGDVSSNGTSSSFKSVTWNPTTGIWYHVAIAYTAASGGMSFYSNGKLLGSTTGSATSIFNGTASVRVGGSDFGDYSDILVKDVRIFNDVRTQAEIVSDARTENVSNANLKAEWNFNGAYTDSSGNGNTLTANNSPVFSVDIPWQAPSGIESSAYVLDLESGSSQYASIADASQTGLDISGDHTIEFWINPESLPSSGNVVGIVAKDDLASNRSYAVDLYNNAGTQTIRIFMSGNATGTNYTEVAFTYTLPVGVWTHVAIATTIANAASSRSRLYINGLDQGNGSGTNGGSGVASIYNGTASFNIGSYSNPSLYFDGLLKHVRVFNDVRTQAEIVADALATTVSDANLKGEWALNNSYADTSGNSNTLTGSGSPTFRKWANKLAGGLASWYAMEGNSNDSHGSANGTDTSVSYSLSDGKIQQGASFASGSNSRAAVGAVGATAVTKFSVSAWVKKQNETGDIDRSILGYNGWSTNGHFVFELLSRTASSLSDRALLYIYGANPDPSTAFSTYVANTDIGDGAYHHVVAVVDTTLATVEYYIDGIFDKKTQYTSLPSMNLGDLLVGSWFVGGSYRSLNSPLDELGIYTRCLDYGNVLDLYNAGSAITYAGSTAHVLTLTEAVVNSDSILRTVSRSLTETLSLSDTIISLKVKFQELTEAFTLTDTFLRSMTKVLSEVVSGTDTLIRTVSRTFSEGTTAADSVIRSIGRVLSESQSYVDTVLRTASRVFSETASLSDALIKTLGRTVSDTATLSDTIVTAWTHGVTFTETVVHTAWIRVMRNGLLGFWSDKFSATAKSWSDKFSSVSKDWDNKYKD